MTENEMFHSLLCIIMWKLRTHDNTKFLYMTLENFSDFVYNVECITGSQ